MMLKKVFLDHPKSVGENYLQHLAHALLFSVKMFYGGLACLIHALVPCLCARTGSKAIIGLHDKMVINRKKLPPTRENLTPGTQGHYN